MKKQQLKIENMHCTSCALSIDMELEDLEGIHSSNTSYAKGLTEVEYDEEKINETQIVEVIIKVGYPAAPVVH